MDARPGIRGEGRSNSPPWRERGNVSSIEGCLEDTFPLCAAQRRGGFGHAGGPEKPTPAFGHPSQEGMRGLLPLLPQNCRVVSPLG